MPFHLHKIVVAALLVSTASAQWGRRWASSLRTNAQNIATAAAARVEEVAARAVVAAPVDATAAAAAAAAAAAPAVAAPAVETPAVVAAPALPTCEAEAAIITSLRNQLAAANMAVLEAAPAVVTPAVEEHLNCWAAGFCHESNSGSNHEPTGLGDAAWGSASELECAESGTVNVNGEYTGAIEWRFGTLLASTGRDEWSLVLGVWELVPTYWDQVPDICTCLNPLDGCY